MQSSVQVEKIKRDESDSPLLGHQAEREAKKKKHALVIRRARKPVDSWHRFTRGVSKK